MPINEQHYHFNSIKVQLERIVGRIQMFLFVNFNSIKVQLEHEMSRYYTDFMLFQFHKGTIRTLFPRCNNPVPVVFQFHKGTIRTLFRFDKRGMSIYFNSIKVQLERWLVPRPRLGYCISIP